MLYTLSCLKFISSLVVCIKLIILCTFLLFSHFSFCSVHFWTCADTSRDAIQKILLDSNPNCYLIINHLPPMLNFIIFGLSFYDNKGHSNGTVKCVTKIVVDIEMTPKASILDLF